MVMSMIVRDVMTSEVLTAPPDARLAEVVATMLDARIGSVVIVAPGTEARPGLLGIVTRSDLQIRTRRVPLGYPQVRAPALLEDWVADAAQMRDVYRAARDRRAREVMSSPVITIAPDRTVWDATELMLDERIGHLPVVEEGRLVGLVTHLDVLRCMLRD